jgi:hypothetical protein
MLAAFFSGKAVLPVPFLLQIFVHFKAAHRFAGGRAHQSGGGESRFAVEFSRTQWCSQNT